MKKTFLCLIAVSMFITSLFQTPITANAEYDTSDKIIEYFDNGYYAEVTISNDYLNTYQIDAVNYVTSGYITYEYKNSADQVEWSYTLHGTFSYNGTSATCINVSDDYNIVSYFWSCNNHSCWASGNTANGTITMNKSILGAVIEIKTISLSLSCSPTGQITVV